MKRENIYQGGEILIIREFAALRYQEAGIQPKVLPGDVYILDGKQFVVPENYVGFDANSFTDDAWKKINNVNKSHKLSRNWYSETKGRKRS